MRRDLEHELGLSQSWMKILLHYEFVEVAEENHDAPFGDVWIKYQSSKLDLAFVRDKSIVSVLVGPHAVGDFGLSQLDDLTHVLGALGEAGPGDEFTLDELASKFHNSYSKILAVITETPPSDWIAVLKTFQRATFANTAPNLLAALELHDSQDGKDENSRKI